MKKLSVSIFFYILVFSLHSQSTITGTITAEDGEPLIGANVIVKGTTDGTVTDINGSFSFSTSEPFPITLVASFVGYQSSSFTISDNSPLNIKLNTGNILADDVIISASRKAEKLQEAPAAVSVISSKEVSASGGSVTPIRALINTPGVELQQ